MILPTIYLKTFHAPLTQGKHEEFKFVGYFNIY